MYLELAAVGFLIGQYVYHRLTEPDKPRPDRPAVPTVTEGEAVPMIYGRCLVERPVLAWIDDPNAFVMGSPGPISAVDKTVYTASMLFVIGAPFAAGDSSNKIWNVFAGGLRLTPVINGAATPPAVRPDQLDGNGFVEDENRQQCFLNTNNLSDPNADVYMAGSLEFLNGNPDQILVDDGFPYNAQTRAAVLMTNNTGTSEVDYYGHVAAQDIPGYRGVLCAFLSGKDPITATSNSFHFNYGFSGQPPTFAFEVSSYHTTHPQLGTYCQVGLDSNPINVIYDLLVTKLGLPESVIDISNFQAAQLTLHQESNGCSIVFDDRQPASDLIDLLLRQIDGALYFDPASGTIKINLVRADFDPADLLEINKNNCTKLSGFAAGGWANLPNKIKVTYRNRARDYAADSETAQNMANAVGQDGQVIETVIDFPAVTEQTLAARLAARELAARSRPVIKCTAIVGREFLRVAPGQAVVLRWANPDVAGLVFRVAAVDRGTLEDGAIRLDLVQDVSSYVWRGGAAQPPDFGSGLEDLDVGLGP